MLWLWLWLITVIISLIFSVNAKIEEDCFGTLGSDPVRRFTLTNENGVRVQVITYGATITSIKTPNRDGVLGDIVLGFDTLEGYLGKDNPYFGATIGRVCNRIKEGKFTISGVEYQLPVNNGPNHLHGGLKGFDKQLWQAEVNHRKGQVVMSYLSKDGEEGYPGDVIAHVTFELRQNNCLVISFSGVTTKSTPISMTNHSYFNLAGHGKAENLLGHNIHINARNYTPVDSTLIPTGELCSVEGTLYDLRERTDLDQMLQKFPKGPNGYDTNFCITNAKSGQLAHVATVQETSSGRSLEIEADTPGVQFYTANFLPDKTNGEKGINGKGGALYWKHGAFCLETQNFPNAVNQEGFPSPIIHPGELYKHRVIYKFSAE